MRSGLWIAFLVLMGFVGAGHFVPTTTPREANFSDLQREVDTYVTQQRKLKEALDKLRKERGHD